MKLRHLAMAAVSMLFAFPAIAQTQSTQQDNPFRNVMYGGVGPVVSISESYAQLPEKARSFVEHNFSAYGAPVLCERDFDDNTYDVEFADGTEIEFDSRGEWIEVDAPGNRVLPASIVKAIMPERAFRALESRQRTGNVETVKRSGKGYKVELREVEYDNLRFAADGREI